MLGGSYLVEAKVFFACRRLRIVGRGDNQGSENHAIRKRSEGKARRLTVEASSVSSFSQSSQTHESTEVGSTMAPQVPITRIKLKRLPEG